MIKTDHLTFDHIVANGGLIHAIRDVTLDIPRGQLVALIGSNGSGKTTLARHFNGLHVPTRGKVWIDSLDTSVPSNLANIRRSVGMVFQNPEDQVISSTVEEEVAFGMENLSISRKVMLPRIRQVLKEYNLWQERDRPPQLLSSGQIQRLAMASVLVMQPQCLIFDETTAMLDPIGRQTVMRSIHAMHAKGLTIIYITHDMDEAVQAERLLVMHAGQLVMDDTPARVFAQSGKIRSYGLELPRVSRLAIQLAKYLDVSNESILTPGELIRAIQKAKPSSRDAAFPRFIPPVGSNAHKCLIRIEHLKHTYLSGTPLEHESLKGVDLEVLGGSIHALLGPTGSGKSTILQHMNGLYRPQSGSVQVANYDLTDEQVDIQDLRRMVGLVFQNPDMQLFEQFVGDEIAFGPKVAGIQGPELRRKVQQAMEKVGLGFEEYKDRPTTTLSGGERKKVTIASALVLDPRILLLDEPLAGLDPASRSGLLKSLGKMVRQGLTLVLSTHNIDDLADLATHVSLVKDGFIAKNGPAGSILSECDLMTSAGLIPPLAAVLAAALRDKGWPLPGMIYQGKQLMKSVQIAAADPA